MSEKEENINEVVKKTSFGRKLLKVLLVLILIFTFFSISLVILSQFRFFRSFALKQILGLVKNELIATIEVDDLTFFNLEGIKLTGARLITDGDTLANIPELILNINYEPLLDQKVRINRLILKNPTIRLLRNTSDSLWNYDKIAYPSLDTTTTPSPWEISVKHLELRNANFLLYDSTLIRTNTTALDYDHIRLDDFDLFLSADVKLKNNDFFAQIYKLRATEKYSQLNIQEFAAKLTLNEDIISATDLSAKLNESVFDINVEMRDFNTFDTINEPDIAKARFTVAAKGYKINDSLIHKFADISISFGTEADVIIDAEGILNKLDVKRVKLVTGNSDINLAGKLTNLLETENFEYEFSLNKSTFTRQDIIKTLKSIDLRGIPDFGKGYAERLYVRGFVDSVYSDMDLKTNIGAIKGKAGMNFAGKDIRYFADFLVHKLDIQNISHNPDLKSSLNGRVRLKGYGTDLNSLKANIETDLHDSQIYGMDIKHFTTFIKAESKVFYVDSLSLALKRLIDKSFPSFESDNISEIETKGFLDLTNTDLPVYKFDIRLSEVDLKDIFDNNTYPDFVSADLKIDMKGFEPDSLLGKVTGKINGLGFQDRAFLPFDLSAEFTKPDSISKSMSLQSDFFKVNIKGNFLYSDLIESLALQGKYLSEFIAEKIESYNPQNLFKNDSLAIENITYKAATFPDIDVQFSAEINDLSPLNIFLDSMSIYSDIKLDFQLISSQNISTLFIDSIKVGYFDLKTKDMQIKTDEVSLDGRLITQLEDSHPKIENVILNLDTTKTLKINELEINDLFSEISFDGSNLSYMVNLGIEHQIKVMSKGNLDIGYSDLKFKIDSTWVIYKDHFKWYTPNPILAHSTPSSISIDQFEIKRDSAETIIMKGSITDDIAKDLSIDVLNLPLTDFLVLTDEKTRKKYAGIKFTMDSLKIKLNGDIEEPVITATINSDSIIFNNYNMGALNGSIIHDKAYVKGTVDMTTPLFGDNRKTLVIDINYLPVYFGIKPKIPLFDESKAMDLRLKATGLPLEILSPFIPGIREIRGFADANIVVDGAMKNGIDYSGNIKSKKARLRLLSTNVEYDAEFDVDFNKDKLNLSRVSLRNIPEDSRFGNIGKGEVTGFIEMKGFDVGELDFTIKADRLLVMTDATMVTMPDLYGDFIISTDYNPIHFYGTLDKPNLDGDVNINYGHLKMPMQEAKKSVRTYFTYKKMDNMYRITSTTVTDTTQSGKDSTTLIKEIDTRLARNISDLINYDITAKILGRFVVEMDMNVIGSMYAVIGTTERSSALRYRKTRNEEEAELFGELIVKEQSTIKSWKQLSASGAIRFPTGSIANPSLDLVATYTNSMMDGDTKKQFIVKMFITGTKNTPIVKLTYFVDGVEASGSQDQINEDALYLLVTGRKKSSGTGISNNSLFDESFTSGVSNFATKALSELLLGTGVINSAELDFQGGTMNLEEATLRLSGQLYGGISWTIGGNVADLSSNNQISIEIPASEFSANPFWSNFVLQLSKASSNNVTSNTQNAKNWEVKIKLGSSW
ncbi:MAG: translocation/assembly module TamB domain-containing protein [Candidatus Kapabacteria bacterium]|nr:translocation/assembly module TamB domain-containing protein [Candidatus Kapabacteria bacterium]